MVVVVCGLAIGVRTGWLGVLLACGASEAEVVVWQPLTSYSISFRGDRRDAAPAINPFEDFTDFATDFGWMGPGQWRIDGVDGVIRTRPEGEWAGVWHSLAGLAVENERVMDLTDLTGVGGGEGKRAKVLAVTLDVKGSGRMKLELADAGRAVRWKQEIPEVPAQRSRLRYEVDAAALGPVKFLNWVSEAGSGVEVSAIGFEVLRPEMDEAEWLFRTSLGKLRRCHDSDGGLTRDRAHTRAGAFDSVASSGFYAMAMAVAGVEGVVEREVAVREVKRTAEAILALPRGGGFFPHFTKRGEDGRATIYPGTEYSTVDTAIAVHGLLLAAGVLELPEVKMQVEVAVRGMRFDVVTDREGWIGHGFLDDGVTLLPNQWRDWGGETALVLALEAMDPDREVRGRMERTGRVFRGVGFISEIQSLFYHEFDREEEDAVSGVSWPAARRRLLEEQRRYFVENWPGSPAVEAGLWGVSAGESGMPGEGYSANGVDVVGVRWIHPHVMALMLGMTDRGGLGEGVRRLEAAGVLRPMGLPEGVEIGLKRYHPMQGSLNAGFETLAAYHGWRGRGVGNVIDRAVQADPWLRRAIRRFYPGLGGG